jgi:hypothetical protein
MDPNKEPIKTSEIKKTPHLRDRLGLRPTLNCLNLGWINFNTLRSNNIAKKRNSIGAKGALLKITTQTCIT